VLTRLLRSFLRPYARPLLIVVGLQLVGTMASLYLPSLNADIIDSGIARGDTGYILSVGGWMLVVTVVQVVCSIGAVFHGARTATGFGRDVRGAVFGRVGDFSAREVNRFGAPSLITRSTNDVQQVQMLVLTSCTMLVSAPIMCVGGVVMALREDVGLSWLVAVCVPVLVVAIGLVIVRMVPKFRLMQVRIDAVNRILREQITGVRVVRAFVREPRETERFGRANTDLTDVAVSAGRLQALIFPIVMLVLNVSSVAVLWFGGHRVDDGRDGGMTHVVRRGNTVLRTGGPWIPTIHAHLRHLRSGGAFWVPEPLRRLGDVRTDHLGGEPLHLLGLGTHLQQQQVDPGVLQGLHLLPDLLGRADQPGSQAAVRDRVFLDLQLPLQLGARQPLVEVGEPGRQGVAHVRDP